MDLDSDSPWGDENGVVHDNEWERISSGFTNAGYREGITAGKEGALQEGFDAGFAEVGVPLGRELGLLRGMASALVAVLKSTTGQDDPALTEAQDIVAQLANVRFSDIAPRDLEAEAHAREHLETYGAPDEEMGDPDILKDKRDVEGLEDLLNSLSTNGGTSTKARPTADDVRALKGRLEALCGSLRITPTLSD